MQSRWHCRVSSVWRGKKRGEEEEQMKEGNVGEKNDKNERLLFAVDGATLLPGLAGGVVIDGGRRGC